MSSNRRSQPDVVLLLCRGCCCGTTAKHPRTDHAVQEQALQDAVADNPAVEMQVVDCLDECDRSNVAVVRKPSAPRADRDSWLGGLLTDRATKELAEWLHAGAAGSLPPAVAGLRFRHHPARRR